MFASEKMIAALNDQIGKELAASLQYIAIASHLSAENLPELAQVFYGQADEERDHAMRFVRFVVDVGGRVRIPALPSPQSDFASTEECVSLSLAWEIDVTGQINDLVEVASAESNHVALRFLDYFVTEQLEEVNKMDALLAVVRRAGEDGLIYVEDYLSRRSSAGSAT